MLSRGITSKEKMDYTATELGLNISSQLRGGDGAHPRYCIKLVVLGSWLGSWGVPISKPDNLILKGIHTVPLLLHDHPSLLGIKVLTEVGF